MSAAEQLRHAPHTAVPGVTPAPPPYTQAMRMNSLNTLNGAGPQVGTMVNVCQIPKRSYTPSPSSASAGHSARSFVQLGVGRGQTVNIAKPLQLRARYFYFATLILSRMAVPTPVARILAPNCFHACSAFRARLARRVRCDMQSEITD